MVQHQRQVAWVVAILALTGLNGAAQTVTFSDQDFNDSDWAAEMIVNQSGSSGRFTANQERRGGNPGSFRKVIHKGRSGSRVREIRVAHLRVGAVYDPQVKGPIVGISHSYDLINLESQSRFDSEYHLLIFQNDTYYRSARDRIATRNWRPFGRSDLSARDFARVVGSGPRQPDFSDSASPLQFGFISVSRFRAADGQGFANSRNSGIDNWAVSIFGAQQQACRIVSVAPAAIDFESVLLGA